MKKVIFVTIVLISLVFASCNNGGNALLGSWEAKTIELNGTQLEASALGGMNFTYNEDGSFVYTESGAKEEGTFVVNENNEVELTYNTDNRKVNQKVENQTDKELILLYDDHGMQRKVTLIKK